MSWADHGCPCLDIQFLNAAGSLQPQGPERRAQQGYRESVISYLAIAVVTSTIVEMLNATVIHTRTDPPCEALERELKHG